MAYASDNDGHSDFAHTRISHPTGAFSGRGSIAQRAAAQGITIPKLGAGVPAAPVPPKRSASAGPPPTRNLPAKKGQQPPKRFGR